MSETKALSRDEVDAARHRIQARVRRTPVLDGGDNVTLKLEFLQHTGTFKPRGMFNRLLAAREMGELTDAGVVAASGGNAGLAVAYAADQLGVHAEVYVPEVSSKAKVNRLRTLGATVKVVGAAYADALAAAHERIAETGALEVHAYDQREVCAGQGTLALELVEQSSFDTVLVAVGGGGLIAGVTAGLAGSARVVAVEPAKLPTLHNALAAGGPMNIEVDTSAVAADSLGARRLGDVPYATVSEAGISSVLVQDDAIVAARQHLWDAYRIITEPGGATAMAALLSGAYVPAPGERIAIICCGANTDPASFVS